VVRVGDAGIGVMARMVRLVTTDDLDRSPDAETVSFGLDG
jgi:hypothetical protein